MISFMKSRSTHCVVGLCGNEIRISLRLARASPVQILQPVQKRRRIRHGQHAGVPFRHDHAVLMNRIRRIRRHHRVARSDDREQQMRQRVLGADGDDRFGLRIELDAVILADSA